MNPAFYTLGCVGVKEKLYPFIGYSRIWLQTTAILITN